MSSFYTKPSAADSDYRTGKQGLGGWVLKQQCWSLPLSYPVDIIVAVSVVWQDNGCVQYGHKHFLEKGHSMSSVIVESVYKTKSSETATELKQCLKRVDVS